MAKAFQCDVCESFDRDEPVLMVTTKTIDPVRQKDYELCVACLAGLTDFLDGPRLELTDG